MIQNDGASSYIITYTGSDGVETSVNSTHLWVTIPNLVPNTTYSFTAVAVNSQGKLGNQSDAINVTTSTFINEY